MSLRGWVAEERARERARSAELRLRETFPQTGPGGQAFPASPIVRSRRANVPPVNVVRNPPYGRSVTVQTTQVFDGGGTACQWANVKSGLTSAGFRSWIANLPQTSFEVPTTGYYDLHLSVEWDVWEQGGFVRVLKNDVAVWFDQAPYGKSFARTFHLGVLTPDDQIVVEVSPVGDAVVQPDGKTADVVCSFDLVELPVQVASDPPTVPPDTVTDVTTDVSNTTSATATLQAPADVAVGDVLVAVGVCYRGQSSGSLASATFAPEFTDIVDTVIFNDGRMFFQWKVADAADVAQTRDYQWTANHSGSDLVRVRATIVGISASHFTSTSSPFGDTGYTTDQTVGLTGPAGSWVLAAAVAYRRLTTAGTGTLVFDAPTVTLSAQGPGGDTRSGATRLGTAASGATVDVTRSGDWSGGQTAVAGVL